jgi:hypothetical protein
LEERLSKKVKKPTSLPQEIRLPKLQQLGRNRGLATRGVDPRDVVRLTSYQIEELRKSFAHSRLLSEARIYRSQVNRTEPDEYAIPIASIREEFGRNDEAAGDLENILGEQISLDRAIKRPSDLRVSWSYPMDRLRRFVMEDGALPIQIAELSVDEVPAQRLFIIDGDASVPVLFGSRLFQVWASATLSRSTSWTPRFSVSKTFETFPIPPSFVIFHDALSNRAQLRLSLDSIHSANASIHLTGLVSEFEQNSATRDWQISSDDEHDKTLPAHPMIAEIDAALLSDIQLPKDASDLDILERLLEMNNSKSSFSVFNR